MGSGSFSSHSYELYNTSLGRSYDKGTGRVSGQVYSERSLNEKLNPKNVMRECLNTEEHPNTIPVILALDVTGSMGSACKETAEALGVLMTSLYEKYKDIQIMVMGIGDLAYDSAPIQISQFESDVRIAEWLDKIWMEHGGGGNGFESYTAAWYMGLHHTKLDAYDKQGRKGIIITMGDELMNPYLPAGQLKYFTGDLLQGDVETVDLYREASEKFDIFHVNVEHGGWRSGVQNVASFARLLGEHSMSSNVNGIADKIIECIDISINNTVGNTNNSSNGISW